MDKDVIVNLLSGAIAGTIADLSTHPLSSKCYTINIKYKIYKL